MRKLEEQLPHLLKTSIIITDFQYHVKYMNASAEYMLGEGLSTYLNQPLPFSFMHDDASKQAFESVVREGVSFTKRETLLETPTGRRWVDFSVSQGAGDSLVIEVFDIDRVHRISQEEKTIHNHQAIRNLIRSIAHEIKTPLFGVRGAAQLLEKEVGDDKNLNCYTDIIIAEVDRLKELTDQFLGGNTLPEKGMMNIHEAVERVCKLMNSTDDSFTVKIQKDYDPSLPEIWADLNQIIQVVLNLMRNAQQALEESGTENALLTVRTRCRNQVMIGEKRHRLVLVFEIHDNGPGIPDTIREQLFFPAVTTKKQGNGLGLSISQDIVSQYNGIIKFFSEPGHTVFEVIIPYMEH